MIFLWVRGTICVFHISLFFFIKLLTLPKIIIMQVAYLLNNVRKGMGVFFCYALLIGRLAMSFQNWVIAT